MSTTVSYRGYDGSVIYDSEDSLYHGKILGIRDSVVYHGETPEEAEKIFRDAVDAYFLDCEQNGKALPMPYASMPAHFSRELQVKTALFAHEHQVDVDKVLNMALTNFLEPAA